MKKRLSLSRRDAVAKTGWGEAAGCGKSHSVQNEASETFRRDVENATASFRRHAPEEASNSLA